jgi:plastocyanin
MFKTLNAGALALALALALGGATAIAVSGPAISAAAAGPTVRIDNFVFGPEALTVPVGTTVTWINQDDIPHTVVASDRHTFKSKVLDSDERFAFTFTKPGEYGYFCSLHPHMVGKVIVTPA